MPEVLRGDAGTALMDYIICLKRHNKPRLHHAVCEATCKNREKCSNYREWYKNTSGKELGADKQKKVSIRRKTL